MTRRNRSLLDTWTPAWLALALLATPAGAGAGRCTATRLAPNSGWLGETIGIRAGAEVPAAAVEEALDLWRGCPNYGLGFPALLAGPGRTRTLTVELLLDSRSEVCGRLRDNRIILYAFARDAAGRRLHCGALALVLAHELGHVLGLADARRDRSCRRHIMSDINQRNRYDRHVQRDECQAVGQRWVTLGEQRWLVSGSQSSP